MNLSASSEPGAPPLLRMRGISKRFLGTAALRGVDFSAWAGEVHALMGENGAGKSTLMKILGAIHRADAGEIQLDGNTLHARTPKEVLAAGISLIHQELSLVPELTVAENIFLGAELTRGGVLLARRDMVAAADALLARLNAGFSARVRARELSIANQQLVEIARSLRCGGRVMVMDEPTAALSERESERLFGVIAQLRAAGAAIIYISHRMAEVERLADRVTVLRDGELVGTLEKKEISARRIVQLMVGRAPSELQERVRGAGANRVVLSVRGLGDGNRIREIDLDLCAGEVVGLAGLVGAGRSEIAQMLFGAAPTAAGVVKIDGEEVAMGSPARAMKLGVAYVPEDRKEQGLFPDLAAETNLTINLADRLSRAGVLRRRSLRASADAAVQAFDIRIRDLSTPSAFLSGGNQHKVLLARWLLLGPKILILDEPTRGVDIAAKEAIYRLIDEQAKRGMAVLLISSELAEIISLSDRVLVLREGRLVGMLDGRDEPITQEAVMDFATGVRACA
ncbi:MAG: Monosaccharide-transporting ATPase [Verrucomicrobia bacterium]|nr:Monosaccharide-transporting ATPase [Verrucomicrobiota bacterium]